MKIVKPQLVTFDLSHKDPCVEIERVARTCYQSRDKMEPGKAGPFVRRLVRRGHLAMLEFVDATATFVCDRGMSHELVRHRLASFAQESTRYCNYSKGKFDAEITCVQQTATDREGDPVAQIIYEAAWKSAESAYNTLIDVGVSPQEARAVLPIGLRTEIVMKCNLREWLHVIGLRDSPAAHPIIRALVGQVKERLLSRVPEIFEE